MLRVTKVITRWRRALLVLAALGAYWFLPISGRIVVMTGDGSSVPWPQIQVRSLPYRYDQISVVISDSQPWSHVLLTVDGHPASFVAQHGRPGGLWSWEWQAGRVVDGPGKIAFYRDCNEGCVLRGQLEIGKSTPVPPRVTPTKLGVVFANPQRNWRGRSGWDVELTYAHSDQDSYWGIDRLASRVHDAAANGLRVLVRVDYQPQQSIPPSENSLALEEYLRYLQRLVRDDRLQDVAGYIIGSGYNALDSNVLAPDRAVTPEWYARVFNGYGEPTHHVDNAVQVIRGERSDAAILVGPVRPWVSDQSGTQRYAIDVPWLNYMNTLVALISESATAKAAVGSSLVLPDGFAIHAPGWPEAPELADRDRSDEPSLSIKRSDWGGAEAGFRVYRDWLDLINSYPSMRGLPVYITSTNTFVADKEVTPAENYPPGWLTNALAIIDGEPQVKALCWFMDGPLSDTQWDLFSLAKHPGRLSYAADEFDLLLR